MTEADRDWEQNALDGSVQRALAEVREVPCLFHEGQRCGVVRSTAGRRLYHFECVSAHVRGSDG